MHLSRPNQKGFISIETFLIIVVLVLVGGTGYFVYHATKKTNDTFTAAAKAAESTPDTSKPHASSSTSAKSVPTKEYLAIKEWGVKIPLTESTKDAYYVFLQNDTSSAYLSLHSLDGTQCAADQTSIGAVFRYLPGDQDPESHEFYSSIYTDGIKVGNYYYRYASPQAGCSDNNQTQTKASDARQQLMNSIKDIKAE